MTLRKALNIAYERGLLNLPDATNDLVKLLKKEYTKKKKK